MKPIEITYQEPKATTPPSPQTLENITGYFPQVTAVPTWIPRSFKDQFAIYASAGTFRMYIYDTANSAWRYTALT